jgi:hypothetical protein
MACDSFRGVACVLWNKASKLVHSLWKTRYFHYAMAVSLQVISNSAFHLFTSWGLAFDSSEKYHSKDKNFWIELITYFAFAQHGPHIELRANIFCYVRIRCSGNPVIYCRIASGPCQGSRSPAELTTLFYCLIWDCPNLEGQVLVFISPRNRVAQLYPRALGSFLSPLTTLRAAVEIF